MIVKLLGGAALLDAGAAVGTATGIDTATFLQLAGVLLGGGVIGSYIQGRHRARSGEDRSAAAEDVSHGASEMAGAVKDLLQPLREENARLHGIIAEKQTRLLEKTEILAAVSVELAQTKAEFETRRHADANELALLAAEIETLKLQAAAREEQIATLEVLAARAPDRRGTDRRDDPSTA